MCMKIYLSFFNFFDFLLACSNQFSCKKYPSSQNAYYLEKMKIKPQRALSGSQRVHLANFPGDGLDGRDKAEGSEQTEEQEQDC